MSINSRIVMNILLYKGLLWRIFLGALTLNIGLADLATGWGSAQAALIALGATAQALAGFWLVRLILGPTIGLIHNKEIFVFVAIILGTCLISPTTGTLTLYSFGTISADQMPYNWFLWFIGDSIGSVVVAPLMYPYADGRGRPPIILACEVA